MEDYNYIDQPEVLKKPINNCEEAQFDSVIIKKEINKDLLDVFCNENAKNFIKIMSELYSDDNRIEEFDIALSEIMSIDESDYDLDGNIKNESHTPFLDIAMNNTKSIYINDNHFVSDICFTDDYVNVEVKSFSHKDTFIIRYPKLSSDIVEYGDKENDNANDKIQHIVKKLDNGRYLKIAIYDEKTGFKMV